MHEKFLEFSKIAKLNSSDDHKCFEISRLEIVFVSKLLQFKTHTTYQALDLLSVTLVDS